MRRKVLNLFENGSQPKGWFVIFHGMTRLTNAEPEPEIFMSLSRKRRLPSSGFDAPYWALPLDFDETQYPLERP